MGTRRRLVARPRAGDVGCPRLARRIRSESKSSSRNPARTTGCQGYAWRTGACSMLSCPRSSSRRSPERKRAARGSASCSCWTRPLPDRYRCCSRPRLLGCLRCRRTRSMCWVWSGSARTRSIAVRGSRIDSRKPSTSGPTCSISGCARFRASARGRQPRCGSWRWAMPTPSASATITATPSCVRARSPVSAGRRRPAHARACSRRSPVIGAASCA